MHREAGLFCRLIGTDHDPRRGREKTRVIANNAMTLVLTFLSCLCESAVSGDVFFRHGFQRGVDLVDRLLGKSKPIEVFAVRQSGQLADAG